MMEAEPGPLAGLKGRPPGFNRACNSLWSGLRARFAFGQVPALQWDSSALPYRPKKISSLRPVNASPNLSLRPEIRESSGFQRLLRGRLNPLHDVPT